MRSSLQLTRICRRTAAPRGIVISAMLACTALCTVGCGSGFNSAGLDVKPDSGSAQVGGVKINGVVVVTDPVTRNAEVVAAVANTGTRPAQLVSVIANGLSATVSPALAAAPQFAGLPAQNVTIAGDTVTIGGGSAVSFGQPARPELEVSGGSFKPGRITRVEFGFAGLGQVGVNVLVMANTGLYRDYNPNGPNPNNPISPAGPGGAAASASSTSSPSALSASSPSPSANLTSSPSAAQSAASIPSASPLSTASSSAGSTVAKASTTLAHTPHLHGSREPRP